MCGTSTKCAGEKRMMVIDGPDPNAGQAPQTTKATRSLAEAISEVNRELSIRERIYPKWIKERKLDTVDAQDRFDRLASALAFLMSHETQIALKQVVTSSGDLPVNG
jgi:hypothetical protein